LRNSCASFTSIPCLVASRLKASTIATVYPFSANNLSHLSLKDSGVLATGIETTSSTDSVDDNTGTPIKKSALAIGFSISKISLGVLMLA
ncbi:hypothetical protein, partial [Klebsiella pneumoniae]|uniref:hypothetical protein n=1 Tax=Klebsiella pneumoniae TaxID=573 RepID=UPI001E36E73F